MVPISSFERKLIAKSQIEHRLYDICHALGKDATVSIFIIVFYCLVLSRTRSGLNQRPPSLQKAVPLCHRYVCHLNRFPVLDTTKTKMCFDIFIYMDLLLNCYSE